MRFSCLSVARMQHMGVAKVARRVYTFRMTRQILSLVFILLLASCGGLPGRNDTHIVRWELKDESIALWKETGDGIEVVLNRDGDRIFSSLLRNNRDSRLEIYAGRLFVTSGKTKDFSPKQALRIDLGDEEKARVMPVLPQRKKVD